MASAGSSHPQVNVDLATVYGEIGDARQYKLDANDQRRLGPEEKSSQYGPSHLPMATSVFSSVNLGWRKGTPHLQS